MSPLVILTIITLKRHYVSDIVLTTLQSLTRVQFLTHVIKLITILNHDLTLLSFIL